MASRRPREEPDTAGGRGPRVTEGQAGSRLAGSRAERIVEAALTLLIKAPYEQIQMREVAESAGVSIATVYRHFASKEMLFAHVLLLWIERFRGRVTGRPLVGATDGDRLADALARSIRAFERAPDIYSAFPAVEACTDPVVRGLYGEVGSLSRAAYRSALVELDGEAAEEVIDLCNAVLNQELRQWTLGRADLAQVYRLVDVAVRLLVAGAFACRSASA